MSFTYPKHFKLPNEESFFFRGHIPLWEEKLSMLKDKPNVCMEIGALYGGASVYILENFCKMEGSHLHIVDLNLNEYMKHNTDPYENVTIHLGKSEDTLRNFTHEGKTKEFLDFVYIDGNHMSKHVLEDAVNAFYLLKPGGIMVFDDYGLCREHPPHHRPEVGIDAFIYAYQAYLEELNMGWHVMLRRNEYDMEPRAKEENYYDGKGIIGKI